MKTFLIPLLALILAAAVLLGLTFGLLAAFFVIMNIILFRSKIFKKKH